MVTSHAEEAEPTLEELMEEPIIQLLMKRDGIQSNTVQDLLRKVHEIKSASSHD